MADSQCAIFRSPRVATRAGGASHELDVGTADSQFANLTSSRAATRTGGASHPEGDLSGKEDVQTLEKEVEVGDSVGLLRMAQARLDVGRLLVCSAPRVASDAPFRPGQGHDKFDHAEAGKNATALEGFGMLLNAPAVVWPWPLQADAAGPLLADFARACCFGSDTHVSPKLEVADGASVTADSQSVSLRSSRVSTRTVDDATADSQSASLRSSRVVTRTGGASHPEGALSGNGDAQTLAKDVEACGIDGGASHPDGNLSGNGDVQTQEKDVEACENDSLEHASIHTEATAAVGVIQLATWLLTGTAARESDLGEICVRQ